MTDDFEAAVKDFRAFIVGNGLPDRIAWVFREDVTTQGRQVAVRWPLSPGNETAVRRRYGDGIRRGLGLRLEVFCLLGEVSCCAIWVPEDDLAAEYAMLYGLKFLVPTDPVVARPIRDGPLWRLKCWRDGWARSGALAGTLQPRSLPDFS